MLFLGYSFTAVLITETLADWFKIEKRNKQIRHGIETLLIAAVYGSLCAWAFFRLGVRWQDVCGFAVSFPGLRWLFHDLLLNLARGKGIDYLGTAQQSAGTDKLLNRLALKGYNQWVVKFGTIAAGFFIAFILQLF